jgi:hypothetical protein
MKNYLSYLTKFYGKNVRSQNTLVLLFLITSLFGCKKSDRILENITKSEISSVSNNNGCNSEESLKAIARILSEKAGNNANFKALAYSLCSQQLYGDYNIRITDLLESALAENFITTQEDQELRDHIEIYYCGTGNHPILFIPHIEEVDESYFKNNEFPLGYPNVSFDFEYNNTTHTTPSYKYDDTRNDLFLYLEEVNEEMAWNFEYDVWIFGEEENVSAENQVAAVDDTTKVFNNLPPTLDEFDVERFDGKKEWGGRIQVTNMGAIEPFVRGKFEFKYFVNKSDGGILKERGFGKWRRKNFKDQNWKDFGDLIGNWTLSNWGPMQLERWIEEDGGSSTTVTQSFSPGSGLPSVTVTHNLKSGDEDLGTANVQFSDLSMPDLNYVIYTLSHMNFTRKSEQ